MTSTTLNPLPEFSAGPNMAMKVPPDRYDQTVRFYRDTLRLEQLAGKEDEVVFRFSGMKLWIDRAPDLQETELWLELCCDDPAEAGRYLAGAGVARCDEVELLPAGFKGFWIRSPAGVVHLVCTRDQTCD